jgi:hypothetical protein
MDGNGATSDVFTTVARIAPITVAGVLLLVFLFGQQEMTYDNNLAKAASYETGSSGINVPDTQGNSPLVFRRACAWKCDSTNPVCFLRGGRATPLIPAIRKYFRPPCQCLERHLSSFLTAPVLYRLQAVCCKKA